MQKTIGLLLVAAAAYGVYRFSKMSPDQKNSLKEKGRDLLNSKMRVSNLFSRKQAAATGNKY